MAACATVPNRVPLSVFTNVLRIGQLKYFFSVFYFSGHFNPASSLLLLFFYLVSILFAMTLCILTIYLSQAGFYIV